MNEKIPSLTSPDLGKDEDSVLVLQKKLDALDRDIDNYQNNIGELAALSRSLVDKGHFDSENIKAQQVSNKNVPSIVKSCNSELWYKKKNDKLNLFLKLTSAASNLSVDIHVANNIENFPRSRGKVSCYLLDIRHINVSFPALVDTTLYIPNMYV